MLASFGVTVDKFLPALLLAFAVTASAGTSDDEAAIRAEFGALSDKINPSLTIAKMREVEYEAARIFSKAQRLNVAVPTVLRMQLENFSIARDTMTSIFKARRAGVDVSQGEQMVLKTIEGSRAECIAFAQSPIPNSGAAPAAKGLPQKPVGAPPTVTGLATESKFMIAAEGLAKANDCTPPSAAMTSKAAGQESFIVGCPNGTSLAIRCEVDGCRILR
jgi:hypothetical protein